MTTKEQLHKLIEELDEPLAKEALEYVEWLLSDEETLTDEEMAAVIEGREQVRRGEWVRLADIRKSLESDA